MSLKFAQKSTYTKIQKFKGGRWRYKLTGSLKFAKSTKKRYKNSRVDVGVTNLQCPLTFAKSIHTKIHKLKGGRWRYKLTVSVKFAKSTIQRYKHSRVDVGAAILRWTLGWRWRYKLTVSLKFAKSTIHRYKKKGGRWRLQTYSVPEICKVYHTEIQKFNGQSLPKKTKKNQGLTLALETLSVLDICNVCHTKNTRI